MPDGRRPDNVSLNAPEYLVCVAELMIDQSKYFPGAFNAEREKVNEIIQMLNMMGQEIRSDQLQQKLRKAEEFRETDSSPAFFE